MNDKDRDLIQQVLQAAGKAGEQGFAYLVHWQLLDGVISFLGYGIVLVALLWGLRRAFAWAPKGDDSDVAHFFRGAAIVALSLTAFGSLCGMLDGLRDCLAPEGAAIYAVLHH